MTMKEFSKFIQEDLRINPEYEIVFQVGGNEERQFEIAPDSDELHSIDGYGDGTVRIILKPIEK